MGRLVIAHHKSYHPYRRDNIEKVRRDEEQAAREEAVQEGRVLLADSEARIELLRSQAGLSNPKKGKKKAKDDDDINAALSQRPAEKQGHINFFEDLEMNEAVTVSKASKKTAEAVETDRGIPLAPSAKDLKPWYNTSAKDEELEPVDYKARGKKDRDFMRKTTHDPLTSINQRLASSSKVPKRPLPPRTIPDDPHAARLSRESSERQKALALKARKKKEKEAAAMLTPSTVYEPSEYGDMFNKADVEAARRERERTRGRRPDARDRGWGHDAYNDLNRRRAW